MADKTKKRRGDRKHGHWLRTIDPYCAFTPYIMKDRDDALNFFSDKVEISAAEAFLRKLRADGVKGVGMLHLFLACYVRTIAKYPALNRFTLVSHDWPARRPVYRLQMNNSSVFFHILKMKKPVPSMSVFHPSALMRTVNSGFALLKNHFPFIGPEDVVRPQSQLITWLYASCRT